MDPTEQPEQKQGGGGLGGGNSHFPQVELVEVADAINCAVEGKPPSGSNASSCTFQMLLSDLTWGPYHTLVLCPCRWL